MTKSTQVSYTGGEWTPTLDARVDLPRFKVSAGILENFFVHAHGPTSNRAGFEFIRATKDSSKKSRLIPFNYNTEQTYILEFGHLYMRVHKDGATVLNPDTSIYELITPYEEGDLFNLRYTQSNDILTICHKDYGPRELSRLDHDDWSLDTITFAPEVATPDNLTAVREGGDASRTIEYRVAAVNGLTGEESIASDKVTIPDADPLMYNTNSNRIAVSWDDVLGDDIYYRLYRWDDYDKPLWGLLAEVEDSEFLDQGNVIPDSSKSFQVEQDPFADFNPSATPTYFKQRLSFAHEQKFFMTQSGNYKNMNTSRPIADSDAIIYALTSETNNNILHLLPMVGDLMAFTAGGVWSVSSGNDAFALQYLKVNKQLGEGCSTIPPVAINDTILMIGADDKSVHDLGYTYEVDKYQGNNLAVMADHLFEGRTIVDRSFQQYPYRILWLPMSDGAFIGLTYMREHNVWGFHRHSTKGYVESVASVREGREDILYAIIRRNINGSDVRYIERMRERSYLKKEDAFFVDCGVSYAGEPITTVTGLDHLEGEEVVALADGTVEGPFTVSEGSVTLSAAASKIHVGLSYIARFGSLDILSEQQPLYGASKTLSEIVLGFYKSALGWVGVSPDNMFPIEARTDEDGYEILDLFTGKIKQNPDAIASNDGRFYYEQRDPLPVTLIAHELTYSVSD